MTRTVVITGGSSGLGLATALGFAREGLAVGLIARGATGLAHAARTIEAAGGRAAWAAADVADAVALGRAADALVGALGAPDVWVNAAGNGAYGLFTDVPAAAFDRVTSVTYGGTVNGTRVALSLMTPRGAGRIVNVCSAVAYHGTPYLTSYAGAKAAVRAFGQAVRAELAGSPVQLMTALPPAVDTPFFAHAASFMPWQRRPWPPVYAPEVAAHAIVRVALGRRLPAELRITGTVVGFALAERLVPRAIALAMVRLGAAVRARRDVGMAADTLFQPEDEPGRVRGGFGDIAREWSAVERLREFGWRGRSGARSMPTPRRGSRDRGRGGSAAPARDA